MSPMSPNQKASEMFSPPTGTGPENVHHRGLVPFNGISTTPRRGYTVSNQVPVDALPINQTMTTSMFEALSPDRMTPVSSVTSVGNNVKRIRKIGAVRYDPGD